MHRLFTITSTASVTLFAALLVYTCRPATKDLPLVSGVHITYTASDADFPNPERGFYRYSETRTSQFTGLDATELQGYRSPQQTSSANYEVVSTLVFRYYILDNFRDGPISDAILTALDADMDAVRSAGVKIIPRFVYTVTAAAGNCPEGFICPPYGDAPKAVVLNHIQQLKPFFEQHADVIASVQMGFIGTWGEQYYSDYFGDPSGNGGQDYRLTDANWQDRLDVLRALLEAVPEDRMVQVRYPQIKQRYVYGIDAPIGSEPLAAAEAFTATDKARIGLHNDCFLSGPNDIGTYEDYGNSSRPRSSDAAVVTTLRNYMKEEGRYVVVGGETCSDDYSPQNDCESAGMAQQEFADMHYSYLNAHYNNAVNNDWQDGGCMDAIKRNLGYRLVLKDATLPDQIFRGAESRITLRLENNGYAAPFNARPLLLVLRNQADGAIVSIPVPQDVRTWHTGAVQFTAAVLIPQELPAGTYELLLHLPDAYERLAGRPEYSIRLANDGVWEEATGYNQLHHAVQVK
ncbi:hypothetical protein GCM10007415_39590 [Parapedobacter pyrenivorans]|uniref:DUF4832 domain-containing protein n=1 Tax=Parapedobacter pyrenivorans TaxID=1305674 RepID=A0A917HZV5_9SPHI|nr:DUF4832 domain-containing protein [Parapedobacter pyrenivorans]GGG99819.1 hypothetical protein GCM10007415_39590 [Parapedobacter pyrenivorans]